MKWYLLSYDRQGGIVHVQEEKSTKYGKNYKHWKKWTKNQNQLEEMN